MPNTTHTYPRGYIAMDNGDLIDVTNISVKTTNNAKQKHTLRQKGAGFTIGIEETTVTFDSIISEAGLEREYIEAVKNGTVKQLRIKIPGRTIVVNGVYKDADFDLPLDDAIKLSLAFIGHMQT